MLTATVESSNPRHRICTATLTNLSTTQKKYTNTMIKVIAIQEQSINSNILLRGKIAFHVRGFEITIDLSMVMKSTAASDAKKKPR